MDTDSGRLYEGQTLIDEAKLRGEVLERLSKAEFEELKHVPQAERPAMLTTIRSKDKKAKPKRPKRAKPRKTKAKRKQR